jgi:hypothetical protein
MKQTLTVRWSRIGFHHWPDAPDRRSYLGTTHRHKFFCEAEIEARHNNREIEFHDVLDVCTNAVPPDGADWGAMSCEMMSEQIARALRDQFGVMRWLRTSVFEDNEVGATTILTAGETV